MRQIRVKACTTLVACMGTVFSYSQGLTFQKAQGSSFEERCLAAEPTSDGGYVMTGRSDSFGAGNWDLFVSKLDANGNVLWSKIYGNTNQDDQGYDIKQTSDGGYIVTGVTDFGSGGRDLYLLKLDAAGNEVWSRTYGGGNNDEGLSVEQTTTGGYIVTGRTRSGSGGWDVYLLNTDSNGALNWSKTIGTGNDDAGEDVIQTSDGGYAVSGWTEISGGGFNMYLIKVDASGGLSWTSIFRTGNNEYGYALQQTSDGGYIMTGYSDDFGPGNWDVVLLKADLNGNLQWSTMFGGASSDRGYDVKETVDGGFIISGETNSFGSGGSDALLLKTDASGVLQWSKTFGGLNDEVGSSVVQMPDNGYLIGGRTRSFGSGDWDMYLVKTDASGNTLCSQTSPTIAQITYSPNTNSGGNTGTNGNNTVPGTNVQSVQSYTTCMCNPVVNFVSTAPQCTGLNVDYTNLGQSGLNYSWNFGSGATPATSVAENPAGIIYSTSGTKQIQLIISDGVCSDSISNTITIHQTPTVSFSSTAPQCMNSAIDFTNTGTTGNNWSYSWDFGQSASPVGSTSENPVNILYTSGGSKVVTLTVSDQHCTETDTASIFIYDLPVAYAGEDTTICPNGTVQIGTSNVAGYSYSWFPSNPLVMDDPSVSNPIVSPVASISNFTVTVIDATTGCENLDSVSVTMLSPVVANAGVDEEICRNESIQIGAGLIEGQFYSWSPSLFVSDTSASNPIVTPDSTTTYVLTVWNDYNCPSESDEVTIIVHQLPDAYAGEDDTITVGESTQLIATGGVQYQWYPIVGLTSSGIYNPLASPEVTTTYVVEVIDIYGCINYDSVNIEVLIPSYWTPTAFTPDASSNKVFYVRGEGIQDFEFRIYNRYGEILFYTSDLKTGWDGRRQVTGEDLPEGSYVYDIQGTLSDGTPVHDSGLINLLR